MNSYQQAYTNPGQDQAQTYAVPMPSEPGLRGQQSSMTNYLLGMLGKGLSVDGLRVLSDSLSNTERDGTQRYGIDTQRYGIDTQADIDRMKNDTQRYGIDSDAATKDYATSQNGAVIKSNINTFRTGVPAGSQIGQTTAPFTAVGNGGSVPVTPTNYLQNYNNNNIKSVGGGGGGGGNIIKSVGSMSASTPYSSNYLRNYGM